LFAQEAQAPSSSLLGYRIENTISPAVRTTRSNDIESILCKHLLCRERENVEITFPFFARSPQAVPKSDA